MDAFQCIIDPLPTKWHDVSKHEFTLKEDELLFILRIETFSFEKELRILALDSRLYFQLVKRFSILLMRFENQALKHDIF